MHVSRPCVALVTAVAMLCQSWLPAAIAADAGAGAESAPVAFFHEKGFDPKDPAAVVRELVKRSQSRVLTFEEYLDKGTAHFLLLEWDKSADAYEAATAKASDRGNRAMSMYYTAQAIGNLASSGTLDKEKSQATWRRAGELANKAQKLVPDSHQIALARLVYWKNAGDQTETRVAEDYLKQAKLQCDGVPVIEPFTVFVVATVGVIAVSSAVVAVSVATIHAKDPITARELIEALKPMMLAGAAIAALGAK